MVSSYEVTYMRVVEQQQTKSTCYFCLLVHQAVLSFSFPTFLSHDMMTRWLDVFVLSVGWRVEARIDVMPRDVLC